MNTVDGVEIYRKPHLVAASNIALPVVMSNLEISMIGSSTVALSSLVSMEPMVSAVQLNSILSSERQCAGG